MPYSVVRIVTRGVLSSRCFSRLALAFRRFVVFLTHFFLALPFLFLHFFFACLAKLGLATALLAPAPKTSVMAMAATSSRISFKTVFLS